MVGPVTEAVPGAAEAVTRAVYLKERQEKRKVEGRCLSCDRAARPGMVLCEDCARKNAMWSAGIIDLGAGYTVTRGTARHWWEQYRQRPMDVLNLYLDQDAGCAVCGEPLVWLKFEIEHNHNYPGVRHRKKPNGKDGLCKGCPPEAIRGLVHQGCNVGLGCFGESQDPTALVIKRLQGAIRYLGGEPCYAA